jgi:hypothetical protein
MSNRYLGMRASKWMVHCAMLLVTIGLGGVHGAEDSTRFGILYGADHAFGFCAPDGWVLDTMSFA